MLHSIPIVACRFISKSARQHVDEVLDFFFRKDEFLTNRSRLPFEMNAERRRKLSIAHSALGGADSLLPSLPVDVTLKHCR